MKNVLCALLLANTVTAVASAQTTEFTDRLAKAPALSATESRKYLDAMARCIVLTKWEVLDWQLNHTPLRPALPPRDVYNQMGDCLYQVSPGQQVTGMMKSDRALLRGALYKALYARRHGKAAPVLPTGAPPAVPDWGQDVATVGGMDHPEVQTYIGLRGFAACVLTAKPQIIHGLLLSTAGSAEENQGVADLGPTISACLPAGMTLTFSRGIFIGLLAETATRLAER